ncbi:uncharacterized protein LOC111068667 [Drosophila obscura]|uniref:uncharacterized protein LOC111068667 n=1 Tax=Drosophila obscura TaxID=7282 RepID=UPI000B9FF124|nr:uncharacterized protein LOC111068667 [Drosophila obscura]
MAMQGIRKLSYYERASLEKWLRKEDVALNPRSRRDKYCEVRPVAAILKKWHPSIELRCYTSASSFSRRLQSWKVFSFRELKKLGLRLKTEDLQQLAEGRPGAVDWLLFRLISKKEVRPPIAIEFLHLFHGSS